MLIFHCTTGTQECKRDLTKEKVWCRIESLITKEWTVKKYELADKLYYAGWDAVGKRDCDPRGCQEWQDVVDLLTELESVRATMQSMKSPETVKMWKEEASVGPKHINPYMMGRDEARKVAIKAGIINEDGSLTDFYKSEE
jgi:hypothetical protein